MPLIPKGLSPALFERIRDRVRQELGLSPKALPPARSREEILVRIRRCVRQDPPKLVRGLYRAKGAPTATWRLMECYSVRERGSVEGSEQKTWLLYAACEKDGWKTEAFRFDRFEDLQPTDIPFSPRYRIEF